MALAPALLAAWPPGTVTDDAPSGSASADPCAEVAGPGPVVDADTIARTCLCDAALPTADAPCTVTRFELDLDLDGRPELLIGAAEVTGNAGGEHLVFARALDGLRYRGHLFLHPKAVRVLPATGGTPVRLMVYVHFSAAQGLLRTIVHDGHAFVTVAEETIEPTGRDRERYASLFGEPGSNGTEVTP